MPRRQELSVHQLGFLDEHFRSREDLQSAPDWITQTSKQWCDSEDNLLQLQRDLTQRAVSWISRSFVIKSSLQNLHSKLENISLSTCEYGVGPEKVQKILSKDMPRLAEELRRIENIRKYVDTALKLEALVGDVEDAVFCDMNHRLGSMFSTKLLNPSSSTDFGVKHERLHHAIKVMKDIEEIVSDVKFQRQWHRLLESVDTRVDKILSVLRPHILAEHRALLASLGWPPKLLSNTENGGISGIPNPLVLMQGDKRKSYCQSFLVLCALQHLQTKREVRRLHISKQNDQRLWPIDELASPISTRMEYHFLKWVEQPEYIFALSYKITRDFIVGVDDVLQPLIDRARLVNYSAKEAWVSAMVKMVSEFLEKRVFHALIERHKEKLMKPEVISSWLHLVDLIIAFDKQMQSLVSSETSLFGVDSESFDGLCKISILTILCDSSDWLKIWAKIELKDAGKKLKADIKDEKAWLIDNRCRMDTHTARESEQFLLSSREEHKAPLIAESALKITWKLIERGLTLTAISPRIQFIRSTAGRFLWYFFDFLMFRYNRSKLCPDDPDDSALITVCGLINAARYVENKLREWSEDVKLLEMRIAEINSNFDKKDKSIDNVCFFGEEVKALADVETNLLVDIIAFLLRWFETQSCGYFEDEEDFASSGGSAAMDLAVSMHLVEALDTLRCHLHLLKAGLNSNDFLDLWRNVADGLDHFISHCIFTSEVHFSDNWINQFETDAQALFLVFGSFCARPEAFFPRIREILKLLKMSKEEVRLLQVVLSSDKNRNTVSHSVGISHLSFNQVEKILRYRKFGS